MNEKIKGYVLGAIAAATYGLNPLFALPLYGEGMAPDSVLFFRYLFAIPIMGLMIVMRGRSFKVARRDVLPIVFMGVLMALSSLSLFESYNYMDASIASTLLFVYPLVVAVIMAMFFHERFTVVTGVCLAMAMCGIGLLFKSSDGTMLSLTGTLLVMVSTVTYAAYIIGVNRPGLRQIPTVKLIFYALIVGVVMFGLKILCTPGGTFTTPTRWYMWGCVVALAVLPTAVSFLCTTAAITYIGPTPTAILGALEPATAVVIGVTVFGEQLSARDWTGLVLIIFAVSLVVAGGKITSYLVRFRKLFPAIRRRKKL